MRDRLQSFGRVRGLVFGQYGEWSEDVDSLLELAATASARRDWRMRGNRTMEESRGHLHRPLPPSARVLCRA